MFLPQKLEELFYDLLLLSPPQSQPTRPIMPRAAQVGAPLNKLCRRESTLRLSRPVREEVSTIRDLAITDPALKGEILVLPHCKTEDVRLVGFILIAKMSISPFRKSC